MAVLWATFARLAQPYRTMLGHFRPETGHWYWDVLVDGSNSLDKFGALFGDPTTDYSEALLRYYASDPAPGWQKPYVSSYATRAPILRMISFGDRPALKGVVYERVFAARSPKWPANQLVRPRSGTTSAVATGRTG